MPEPDYYELLGVTKESTAQEIRKKYYALAVKHHPDKNPSPESHELFKKLSEAYQVLSDPEKREQYDKYGTTGEMVDAESLFSQLFGGGMFGDLIGDISLGKMMSQLVSDSDQSLFAEQSVAERNRIYEERVRQLVLNLERKTAPFIDGGFTQSEFEAEIKNQVQYLKEQSFGIELLHSIGYVYMSKSQQALGKDEFFGIPSIIGNIKEKGHIAGQVINLFSSMRNLKKSETADQEMVTNILWNSSDFEVQSVLRRVCTEFLKNDPGKKKARALQIIGNIYRRVE